MPARSVAFANLRGGCGKSTILFQLASEFAKVRGCTSPGRGRNRMAKRSSLCSGPCRATPGSCLTSCSTRWFDCFVVPLCHSHATPLQAHASTGVLVVDCTAFGDVSRLLLGGRQPHVKKAVAEQHADGRSTAHLLSTLLGPEEPPAVPTTLGRAGIAPMSGGAPRAVASWAASTLEMDVAKRFGVPVSEVRGGRGDHIDACDAFQVTHSGFGGTGVASPRGTVQQHTHRLRGTLLRTTASWQRPCIQLACTGLLAGEPWHPYAQPAAHP